MTVVILVILAFGLALAAAMWRYDGIVDSKHASIRTSNLRIEAKDEQLSNHRLNDETTHLDRTPDQATSYSHCQILILSKYPSMS